MRKTGNMSDILPRFLIMARRRDQSILRRFFFADEPLLESGVEQLVESAAARVVVTSQHERVRKKTVTVPKSRHRGVRFYEAPEPNRPTPERFERRAESFPLRKTLKISRCGPCSGRGTVTCGPCFGRGQDRCKGCHGSGRAQSGSGRRWRKCRKCGGSGATPCRSCRGTGLRQCPPCAGEGRMATWKEVVHDYRLENRTVDRYPLAKPSNKLRQAFSGWLKADSDVVADFEPGTVASHLGYETPQALEVTRVAEQDCHRLAGEARASGDVYLFHKITRSLTPVGYSVVRRAGHALYYWLVGRGEKAREISPAGRLDWLKILSGLSLGPWAAYSYQGLVQAFGLSGPLWNIPALAELSAMSLALGVASFGALMLVGLRRWLARPSRVAALGFFHPSGEPTSMLPCLAYLGSYTGSLSVVDRAYATQTERLLGNLRPSHRSETLAIELADGRKVYLIDVARPHEIEDSQLKGLLEALDGAVILEDGAVILEDGDDTSALESRLRSLGPESLRISTARFNRDPEADPEKSSDLPIEALRAAFVGHFQADVDWNEMFGRLWQPVQRALEGPRHSDPLRSDLDRSDIQHQLSPSESHEPAVEVQKSAVPAPIQEFDEGAHPRSRGLREEFPHRDLGSVHLAS